MGTLQQNISILWVLVVNPHTLELEFQVDGLSILGYLMKIQGSSNIVVSTIHRDRALGEINRERGDGEEGLGMFHQVVGKFPPIIARTGTVCGGRSAFELIHEPEVYDEA